MARHSALSVCPTSGCPELTAGGPCPSCRGKRETARGTSRQRGYGRGHETRFRRGVLARDPVCVRCRRAPSQHADHHPLSRDTLVLRGLDSNDPCRGRGLCASCHSIETSLNQGNNFGR